MGRGFETKKKEEKELLKYRERPIERWRKSKREVEKEKERGRERARER